MYFPLLRIKSCHFSFLFALKEIMSGMFERIPLIIAGQEWMTKKYKRENILLSQLFTFSSV